MLAHIRTKEQEREEQPAKDAGTAADLRCGWPEADLKVSAGRGSRSELVGRPQSADRVQTWRARSRRQFRGCAGLLPADARARATRRAGRQDCRTCSGPLRNTVHQNEGLFPLHSDRRVRLCGRRSPRDSANDRAASHQSIAQKTHNSAANPIAYRSKS